eukprot:TRINITY_DN10968_c0_g1_i3.p1 TRINITY_DN10968_c0_g1~~TRINITY_DN10968_c0_g1_i3.p1  ORF type:complete len:126 (-),score=14.53 TRINITY_DN10968_c0_g1_i3:276-653(-)
MINHYLEIGQSIAQVAIFALHAVIFTAEYIPFYIMYSFYTSFFGAIERLKQWKRSTEFSRAMETRTSNISFATDSDDERDCIICWEAIGHGKSLPCGHFFHETCIRRWLIQNPICPTCRSSIYGQ